jgi:hypothetical protein
MVQIYDSSTSLVGSNNTAIAQFQIPCLNRFPAHTIISHTALTFLKIPKMNAPAYVITKPRPKSMTSICNWSFQHFTHNNNNNNNNDLLVIYPQSGSSLTILYKL